LQDLADTPTLTRLLGKGLRQRFAGDGSCRKQDLAE
jgi:hypothetical protein